LPGRKIFPGRHILLVAAGLWLCSALSAQWLRGEIDEGDMAQDLAEALTFRKYPTYEQYLQMMQQFAADHPGICRLDTFGVSVQGRLLLALKISDRVGEDEPEAGFFYTSTMHGDELAGYVLLLRLAAYLLEGYGSDGEVTGLVDSLAIWINPLANPDGTYGPGHDTSVVNSTRENTNGINLNRDFPDPDQHEPNDTAGRAVETRHMMRFMEAQKFTLSANLHSGAEVVNYPWDHTFDLHADDSWYRFVSREYADEARAVDPGYMNLFEDGITNGARWYVIYGGRQDYVNYYLGGREVTLELANDKLLEADRLEEFWEKNQRSLLNYMSQCTYGIRGRVRGSGEGGQIRKSGEEGPLRACITIPGHDSAWSVVYSSPDHGYFYRLIKEGTWDVVVSADGWLSDTVRGVEVTDYRATWLDITLDPIPYPVGPEQSLPGVLLYPNPASRSLFVLPRQTENGPVEVRILTMEGRPLLRHTTHFSGHPLEIPLHPLPDGIFILQMSTGKTLYTMKFLKH